MVRAARGEAVERAPCWMMRQAGRWVHRRRGGGALCSCVAAS
jgi:uroporphyrinogen-III decarboxylase